MSIDYTIKAKVCSRCHVEKQRDSFPILKRVRSGMHPCCLDCRRAYAREYWRKNYISHPRRQTNTKFCSECKEAKPKTEFYLARGKGKSGRQSYCKTCTSYRQIERFYGLSRQGYDALLKAQDSQCAICGDADGRLSVDHCHETGCVRGLLCKGCNRAIARIERTGFLDEALAYLNRASIALPSAPRGQRVIGNRSQKITGRWAEASNLVQWRPAP
jgi:hypothetical protein